MNAANKHSNQLTWRKIFATLEWTFSYYPECKQYLIIDCCLNVTLYLFLGSDTVIDYAKSPEKDLIKSDSRQLSLPAEIKRLALGISIT